MNEPTFKTELVKNIKEYIKTLRREGTVSMSVANLRQCVPTPKTNLEAPTGPSGYVALFDQVCAEEKTIAAFVD